MYTLNRSGLRITAIVVIGMLAAAQAPAQNQSPTADNNRQGIIGKRGKVAAARPIITGNVDGDNVILETSFPRGGTMVRYHYRLTEDALRCSTRRGFETTFTRLQQ